MLKKIDFNAQMEMINQAWKTAERMILEKPAVIPTWVHWNIGQSRYYLGIAKVQGEKRLCGAKVGPCDARQDMSELSSTPQVFFPILESNIDVRLLMATHLHEFDERISASLVDLQKQAGASLQALTNYCEPVVAEYPRSRS